MRDVLKNHGIHFRNILRGITPCGVAIKKNILLYDNGDVYKNGTYLGNVFSYERFLLDVQEGKLILVVFDAELPEGEKELFKVRF